MANSAISSAFSNMFACAASPTTDCQFVNAAPETSEEQAPRPHKPFGGCWRASLIVCDFRPGCKLIVDAFPNDGKVAQAAITSTPHLAEALLRSGLITNGKAAIDMALALQEARTDPLPGCSCLRDSKAV